MNGPLGNYPPGRSVWVRLDDAGLLVEVTDAEIAAGEDLTAALAERINRADLVPLSFGFGPPRPYSWREHLRLLITGWWSRGR